MILNEKYNQEDFNSFLNDFLPEDFKPEQKDIELDSRYKTIKSAQILGRCESIGLYVLELSHEKERDPRVTLANEAFKIMADAWAKKALVVFRSGSSGNWRLSYMTITLDIDEKNKVVQNFSNPRRKSFYLGPDARIATPKKYLFKSGRVKTIEELEACFDVEVVTKEFFENYRKLFNKLSAHLKEDKAFAAFAGNNSIKLEDFAKKLLGQIVFIYFLQKKGWLGAKKEQHIYEGDPNFLRNLIIKCESDGKNFFNNKLEPLFYNAFNNEPERAGNFYREYFDCQIPFLNGGLFEPLNKYDWKNSFLHIPDELFSNSEDSGILDVFDLYNFTIDENSPVDQEVSVDPEMLGKVFEKLLDTNKETGSFYTPREIVSYMVKQSLIEYLKTKTDAKEPAIEELVNNHQVNEDELKKQDYAAIEKALKEIKIIDPAVGSGAFPVGILQEMTSIRQICQSHTTSKPMLAYDIKREILENNIYGVDIDHGAIDIARLRFWLSLVVDADLMDVEPLPNLDFKLVAANTLLKLDGEAGLYDEKDLLDKMKELREKYFRARTKTSKEKIQSDYKKLISRSNHMFATDRQRQITTYDPFSPSSVAQFFDPEFMFGIKEFDIVIGNPPYVFTRDVDLGLDFKKYVNDNYFANIALPSRSKARQAGKINLFALFILRGKELFNEYGNLIFIIPNNILRATVYDIIRYELLTRNDIKSIVDLGTGVFDKVTASTILMQIGKKTNTENFKSKIILNVDSLIGNQFDKKYINQNIFLNNISYAFNIMLNETELQLSNKILKDKKIFGEYCVDIIEGIVAHKHLIKDQPDKNTVELLEGKDIKRFAINKASNYLTWDKNKIHRSRPDYLWNEEKKIIMQRISGGSMPLVAAIDREKRKTFASINNIILKNEYKDCYEFFTGLMNSRLINWFYAYNFSNKSNLTVNISKTFLESLPIPNVSREQNISMKKIVNRILEITSNELYNSKKPQAEQIALEKEIDTMVYNFYGLTEDEIKIIENNLSK